MMTATKLRTFAGERIAWQGSWQPHSGAFGLVFWDVAPALEVHNKWNYPPLRVNENTSPLCDPNFPHNFSTTYTFTKTANIMATEEMETDYEVHGKSDLTLTSDSDLFYVHQSVVCAQSPVLKEKCAAMKVSFSTILTLWGKS